MTKEELVIILGEEIHKDSKELLKVTSFIYKLSSIIIILFICVLFYGLTQHNYLFTLCGAMFLFFGLGILATTQILDRYDSRFEKYYDILITSLSKENKNGTNGNLQQKSSNNLN